MSKSILLSGVSALVLLAAGAAFAFAPLPGATAAAAATTEAGAAPEAAAADPLARHTVGNLVIEGIPEIPAAVNETLLKYQNARSAGFSGWTPTGGMLIATRFGETAQVHRVDMPMGMRRQLTFYAEPVGGGSYPEIANAGGFLFSKDTGGDENYQLYLHQDASGEDVRISEPGTRSTDGTWSHDGKRVAWTVSSQENALYQIFVADVADPASRKKIFEREGSWGPSDWSPDGSKLLLGNYVSATEGYIYLLDVASGELTQLNKQDGQKIAYGGAEFSPDGTAVYYTSDEGREFQTLTRINIADGAKTLVSGDVAWDVESFDLSPDGSLIVFAVNENGASRVYVRRTADGTDAPAPQLPPGEIAGIEFSPDGTKLGFGFASAKSAGDAWSFDLGTSELVRWTESEIGGLNADSFVDPVMFSYKSFDDRPIPAFIYKPKGAGPFPVVINIHGGPESQERPSFAPIWQYWVNQLGIAVIVPNVRGSSGYGKSYLELDNGFKRKDSVKDIGALLDWVAEQPDLAKDKVMVYGGSYGGYMVNASMVDYSDRLAGGVSIVGISSFVTFLENTSGYRQDLRRVEYGDERNAEMRKFQEDIAPINHVDKITKPMFIIHGANDPRVPVTEAEALFDAVKKNGQHPWWLLATDEGHGFRKKTNRDFMNAAVTLFFEERLLGKAIGN
ncbi:Tol-Pal system protein TolB [Alphaproteobacteria bacterium SO-S41]|nr:Tol-Pal system protein TolB [Alphaproteobacteria bacterium SO-S41]